MTLSANITDFLMSPLSSPAVPKVLSNIVFLGSTSETSIQLDIEAKSISSISNIELIRLNSQFEDKLDFLLKIPFIYDRLLLKFNKNIDIDPLKCVLTSPKASATFNINSYDIKLPLNNNFTDLLSLEVFVGDMPLVDFKFYREPLSVVTSTPLSSTKIYSAESRPSINVRNASRDDQLTKQLISSHENPFPIPMSDGPLFREALNTYEQLAPNILKQLQNNIENMNNLDNSLKNLDTSKTQLLNSLREFRKEFLPWLSQDDIIYSKFDSPQPKSPLVNDFSHSLLQALHHSTSETKIDFLSLRSLQNFGSSKKNFEDESKKYYDWLSKLMGSGKSKDEKLLLKMKNFAVAQIEYFNFLYDTVSPMLLALVQPNSPFSKEYWTNRPLRDDAVDKIKKCSSLDEFSRLMQKYSTITTKKKTLFLNDQNSSYTNDAFGTPLKTGLLFVFGGQGKSGWHKQWLVLRNGKLYEYMDWRRGAELRNEPIDISLCNIKLLDSSDNNTVDIGSRKNCFRVINAQGVEHVFQSFTPADANEWVKALFEAGQMIAFSKQNNDTHSNNATMGQETLSIKNKGSTLTSDKGTGKVLPLYNNPRVRRVSSVSLSLLHVVQHTDPSNMVCSDCGSTEQVEWISLNLLVVFCIQCSSCHRSLGTSISKVRSLRLDSFTGESRALVHHINNKKVNSVYEANLTPNVKPSPLSSNEARLEFITNKYMKKVYVDPKVKKNSSHILLEGVRDDNVDKVLQGIAGCANLNKKIHYRSSSSHSSVDTNAISNNEINTSNDISFLEYALLHPSILDGHEVFDIAELLALNGCDVGTEIRQGSHVDKDARKWWQERINKINGVVTKGSNTNSYQNMPNQMPIKPSNINTSRTSISGSRPSLSLPGSHRKHTAQSKSKLKSPKEGFNLFKKKIKNLE